MLHMTRSGRTGQGLDSSLESRWSCTFQAESVKCLRGRSHGSFVADPTSGKQGKTGPRDKTYRVAFFSFYLYASSGRAELPGSAGEKVLRTRAS